MMSACLIDCVHRTDFRRDAISSGYELISRSQMTGGPILGRMIGDAISSPARLEQAFLRFVPTQPVHTVAKCDASISRLPLLGVPR